MAKKVNKETKKQLVKTVKVDIRKRMEDALADFKAELGEKKFEKRLKKASAIFSDGIVLHKNEPKKTQKKKTKKEAAPEQAVELTA
ncbi:MAG: hypothetical protein WDO19_10480 [Bacteroidota bacterium]